MDLARVEKRGERTDAAGPDGRRLQMSFLDQILQHVPHFDSKERQNMIVE